MQNYDINLNWSKLTLLTTEEVNRLNGSIIEGVYRISKKETDGKFYVIFVGSTVDLKKELLSLLSAETGFLKQGGEFSFRYAPINDENKRKAIEKQMYKQYAPPYNAKEPISSLDIKVNLT